MLPFFPIEPLMPQSLSNVIVHFVFSTKYREPFLHDGIRQRAHEDLASIVRNNGCECYRVGGIEDHVHLAVRLSRTLSISDLLEEIKAGSSRWIKGQDERCRNFAWQRGYGAFSAYYRDLDKLLAYIDGQEEHHHKHTFQDEYRSLLIENGVEFDERYVWD